IVLDFASSEVAFGKIMTAAMEGRNIPLGWALNESGEPTTNAKEALKGTLLPLGGHKGSGLAIIVEVFSAILSGAFLNLEFDKSNHWGGTGFFFGAFDIAKFLDLDVFKVGIDKMIDNLKASNKSDVSAEIYMPGELSY